MGYYVDLNSISLADLKQRIATSYLIPSQRILLDELDARFAALQAFGIHTVAQLQQALKTKAKVEQVAEALSLPVDYLTVLRRLVNSLHPDPRDVADFTCVPEETRRALGEIGIKTTVDLYARVTSPEEQQKLKAELHLTDDMVRLLAHLVDVCRLRYVSPAFAQVLVNSSYDSVAKIAAADPERLYAEVLALNRDQAYFKGSVGLNDMKFLVEDAGYLL